MAEDEIIEEQQKGTIIVVDDEEAVRELLARALRKRGYEVATAANGWEALGKVSQEQYDVMFLDISMPEISGLEVLSRMTKDHPDTVVVMLTAVMSMSAESEAMRRAAFAYVKKPCRVTEIAEVAEKALRRRAERVGQAR